MKISFVAINSKYIHSSLSVRYLKGYAERRGLPAEMSMAEYTINMSREDVVSRIYSQRADVYCFSMYIFNRTFMIDVISALKKLLPSSVFIVGGPEASGDDEGILRQVSSIDFVSLGEGEAVLYDLLSRLCTGKKDDVKKEYATRGGSGVSFMYGDRFVRYPNLTPVCDLDDIPFPYTEEELSSFDKMVYYETSRGCPFFCTYCCSGKEKGVRSFSLDRIFNDISVLMRYGLRQVKLIDRTFNYDKKRALKIMRYMAANHNGVTNFHLEITPWLIDEEFLGFLSGVPTDIFRFEVGIQTTNPRTLRAINRNVDIEVYEDGLRSLVNMGFCVHLDLIAGLPYEDYDSFGRSFDKVISFEPEELQLGFLKVLKGTAIAEDISHGIVSLDQPPYTILYNRYISFEQLESLRRIESLTERYFNGDMARATLKAAANEFFDGSVFAFLEGLSSYFESKEMYGKEWSPLVLYDILAEYLKTFPEPGKGSVIKTLGLDYYRYGKQSVFPSWLEGMARIDKDTLVALLKDVGALESFMSDEQKRVFFSRDAKKWFRKTEVVELFGDGAPEKYLFIHDEGLKRSQSVIPLFKTDNEHR